MSVNIFSKITETLNTWYNILDYYASLYVLLITIPRWQAMSKYMESLNNNFNTNYFEPNTWLDIFVEWYGLAWCLFGVITFFLVTAQRVFKDITAGRDNYLANYVHFDDLEEEVGSVDDSTHYFLFFVLIIVWFYFFTVFARFFIIKHSFFIISIFMCVLISGFLVPAALLKQMGIQFAQYVRGSGRSSNVFFEIVLDAISVSVIMIRFFVQNIRFVFVFLAFFEIYEFILDLELNNPLNQSLYINWTDASNYIKRNGLTIYILFKLFITWGMYLYYLGHLTILFIIQLAIYFILSFWLYFFLYTSFFFNSQEKYFFFKKAMLNN